MVPGVISKEVLSTHLPHVYCTPSSIQQCGTYKIYTNTILNSSIFILVYLKYIVYYYKYKKLPRNYRNLESIHFATLCSMLLARCIRRVKNVHIATDVAPWLVDHTAELWPNDGRIEMPLNTGLASAKVTLSYARGGMFSKLGDSSTTFLIFVLTGKAETAENIGAILVSF